MCEGFDFDLIVMNLAKTVGFEQSRYMRWFWADFYIDFDPFQSVHPSNINIHLRITVFVLAEQWRPFGWW